MKKTFRIAILLILATVMVLFPSCNNELKRLDSGSVNEYIYPYVKFTPTEDGSACTAVVVSGAKLTTVKIPATNDGVPVIEFKGFENPEDARFMKKLEVGSDKISISPEGLKYAGGFDFIIIDRDPEHNTWGKLPVLEKDGYCFRGWYAGDSPITEGMPIDPKYPNAVPRWEEHKLNHHEAIAATCINKGMKEYWHCSVCGKDYSSAGAELTSVIDDLSSLVIPTTGHNLVHYEKLDPDCINKGHIEYWECANCHQKYTDESGNHKVSDVDIDPLDHRYSDGSTAVLKKDGFPATCEKDGMRPFYYCNICKRKYKDESLTEIITDVELIIPALGHDYSSNWESDIESHWHSCLNPGCDSVSDKAAHTWSEGEIITKPDYDNKGQKKYVCTVCGREKHEDIPAIGHKYDIEVVVPPTCTTEGYTKLVCSLHSDCGKWIYKEGSRVAPINHNKYGEYAGKVEIPYKAATCLEPGNNSYWYCDICKKYFTDATCATETNPEENVISPLGHLWSTSIEKIDEATHGYKCLRDGCTAVKDVTSHSYNQQIVSNQYLYKEATCKDHSYYYRSCICGDFHKDTSNVFEDLDSPYGAHTLEPVAATDATCTESGNLDYWKCSVCGKLFADAEGKKEITLEDVTIPANGHVFGEYVLVDKNYHQCKCSVCGELYGDKIEHEPADPCGFIASEDNSGHYKVCKYCHQAYGDKLEHRPSGTYELAADNSGHYEICSDCGEAYGIKINHEIIYAYDDDDQYNHYQKCYKCGYKIPNSTEAHIWNVLGSIKTCDKCGCVYKDPSPGGGFGVEEENFDPEGHFNMSNVGNKYKFEFVNDNPENCLTEDLDFRWTVNGKTFLEGKGNAGAVFELTAEKPRSYLVDCIFVHKNGGVGSYSLSVTGGEK